MFSQITSAICPCGGLGWTFLFCADLVKPRLEGKASRNRFRFQRRRQFIGKLDHRYAGYGRGPVCGVLKRSPAYPLESCARSVACLSQTTG